MDTKRDESRATERPTWRWQRREMSHELYEERDGQAPRHVLTAATTKGDKRRAPSIEDEDRIVSAVNQHAALLACREALARMLEHADSHFLAPYQIAAARAALAASQPKAEG